MTSFDVRPPAIDLVEFLGATGGPLAQKMDIQFHELRPDYALATMPVEGNTQTFGILHGGAYVVLGESMGSICANVYRHSKGWGGHAVGIEINASHTGSAKEGFVIAECTALHLGRTLTTHEIVVRDQSGRRLSTVRITNLIKSS